MSDNKAQDAYKEASEITKYQILDEWSFSAKVTLGLAVAGSLLGSIVGYELSGALVGALIGYASTCPSNARQVFERNLEAVIRKYKH
jgi:hypothetical protein